MKIFSLLFQTEKKHFDRLSTDGKNLVWAFFLYSMASPIFVIFANAFLWRESQSITTLALYNICLYAGLPMGFYLNWFFLKKTYPPQMYFAGAFAQITTVSLLIFFGHINPYMVAFYGLLYGTSAGFYWANRNTLTLRIVSKSENRMYFSSLDQTFNSLSGIVIPMVIGILIVFGETRNLYSATQGYYLVSFLGMIAVILSGLRAQRIRLKLPDLSQILIHRPSIRWQKMRAVVFINGFLVGINGFIPVFLVLHFIGREDALGTVQSLSAIAASIIVYTVAKRVTTKHRVFVASIGVGIAILAALSFAINFSKTGVFMFFIFQALALPLFNVSYLSYFYDGLDEETKEKNNHYAHILDAEIFTNLGRIISIYTFIFLVLNISEDFAIRYIFLIFTIAQIGYIVIAHTLEKQKKSAALPEYAKAEATA